MASFREIRRKGKTLEMRTRFFFDRAEVIKRTALQERRALSRIGAFIRRTMKSSMTASTGKTPHAPPGSPPRYSAKLIRNFIDFDYSPRSHSVVIGPVFIPSNPTIKPLGKTVPQLLDEGGFARAPKHYALKNTQTGQLVSFGSIGGQKIAKRKSFNKPRSKWKRVLVEAGVKKYKARPFKGPALAANITQPKLQSAWSVVS